MQIFPTVLKSLISKDTRTASAIADAAGFNGSILSKICGGTVVPDSQTIAKLLTVFSLKQKQALIAAWMEDRASEIGVSASELRACLSVEDGLHVSPALRRDLSIILARGGETPEFRAVLRSIAACLVPLPGTAEVPVLEVAEGPGPVVPPPRRVTYKKARKS